MTFALISGLRKIDIINAFCAALWEHAVGNAFSQLTTLTHVNLALVSFGFVAIPILIVLHEHRRVQTRFPPPLPTQTQVLAQAPAPKQAQAQAPQLKVLLSPAPTFFRTGGPVFPLSEVKVHCTVSDLWLIIDSEVYDATSFAPDHPGGTIINKYAGKDCSDQFKAFHRPRVAGYLKKYR